jgi:hypothetical protein
LSDGRCAVVGRSRTQGGYEARNDLTLADDRAFGQAAMYTQPIPELPDATIRRRSGLARAFSRQSRLVKKADKSANAVDVAGSKVSMPPIVRPHALM